MVAGSGWSMLSRPKPAARRAMPAIGVIAALVAIGWIAAVSQTAGDTGALDLCAFRPTFIENFNTLSVSAYGTDGSRWIAHTPWGGDFGDAAFTSPKPGFPFQIHDGILQIEARKDAGGKWRSGLLASMTPSGSGFGQLYGYFEMRAKLPPGPGTWPAFWLNNLLPPGSKQPAVEIDVMEYYGQFTDSYHSTVHVWDTAHPKQSREAAQINAVPPGSLTSAFHTYGADIEPDWTTFYLDRQEVWRTPTPPELRLPQMILVDFALGSGWPIDHTPNPSMMLVDYIHAYARRAPGDVDVACPAPTNLGK
jgi:beta-glucanase (GH16 family)